MKNIINQLVSHSSQGLWHRITLIHMVLMLGVFAGEVKSQCNIVVNDIQVFDLSCPGTPQGEIQVFAACSTCGPLEYSLDNLVWQSESSFYPLSAGFYDVYIRDSSDTTCDTLFAGIEVTTGDVDVFPPTIIPPLDITVEVNNGCEASGVNIGSPIVFFDNCSFVNAPIAVVNSLAQAEVNGTFGTLPGCSVRDLENPVAGYNYGIDPGGCEIICNTGNNCHPLNDEGDYLVANRATAVEANVTGFWDYFGHTTGTPDDAFLIVNGNTVPAVFYSEVLTLNSNVEYEYGFWAAGAENTFFPGQLQSRIVRVSDGVVVNEFESAELSQAVWQEFKSTFVPDEPGEYRFELSNISTQIGGNDFAIDDIFFRNTNPNFVIGTTEVLWYTIDDAGNVGSAVQNVTVVAPNINLKGNGINIDNRDENPNVFDGRDFGFQRVGSTTTNTFSIENTGTDTLIFGDSPVVTVMQNTGDFSIISNISDNSLPNGSPALSFDVQYSPSDLGPDILVAAITSNDCDVDTFFIAFIGAANCDIVIESTAFTPETCPGASDGTITVGATCSTCSDIEYSLDGITWQMSNTFTGLASDVYEVFARDVTDITCLASQSGITIDPGVDNTPPQINCSDITITLDSLGEYNLSQLDLETITTGSIDDCSSVDSFIIETNISAFGCEDVAGQPNNLALSFDESTEGNGPDYAKSNNSVGISGNAPRTLEFWIRMDETDVFNEHIINWGGTTQGTSFGFYQSFNSTLIFYTVDNPNGWDYNTGHQFEAQEWYHIAATWDGTAANIYVNGMPTPNPTWTPPGGATQINTIDSPLFLAVREDLASATYSTIDLDEVRVWDYARSQAEIMADMNIALDGSEVGLVLYYDMELDGPGSANLVDKSTNANNGTLINMDVDNGWIASGSPVFSGGKVINVTVTDEAGNSSICNPKVFVNPNLQVNATSFDEECGMDGSLEVSVLGGVPPYNFIITKQGDGTSSTLIGESPQIFDNLSPDIYIISVENNGCTATIVDTVNAGSDMSDPIISGCPPSITLTLDLCNELTIDLDMLGVTISDNCTLNPVNISQTTFSGVDTTDVTISVSDAAGNESSCTIEVMTEENPDYFEIITTAKNLGTYCQGADIIINQSDVLGGDSTSNGSALEVQEIDLVNSTDGTIVDNGDGTWTFTPSASFTGAVSLTYLVKTEGNDLFFSDNGHFYEFIDTSNISWSDAKIDAESRVLNGQQGYLVTITSQEEQDFVTTKLNGFGWTGGRELPSSTSDMWYWVTGPEGDNGGLLFDDRTVPGEEGYTNWGPNEPNNDYFGIPEDFVHLRSDGVWNDYPDVVTPMGIERIDGYIIEYGGLESCTPQFTATSMLTLTIAPLPTIDSVTVTQITCPGGNDGGFAIFASCNSCAGLEYSLDGMNWQDNGIFGNLAGGTFDLQVRDIADMTCVATSTWILSTPANELEPPMITAPADITVSVNSGCEASGVVLGSPIVSDNCSPDTLITIDNDTAGTQSFAVGTTNVIWTATDESGNTSTASQTVTVLAADISVKGNNMEILNNDITPSIADDTDFGVITVGSFDAKFFVFVNSGTDTLHFDQSNAFEMTGSSEISISSSPFDLSIPPGDSNFISIQYAPVDFGIDVATLIIRSDDCDEGVFQFNIQGGGSGPCDLEIIDLNVVDEDCETLNDGSIEVTAMCPSCGTLEYSLDSVNWSLDPLFTNLAGGIYTIYTRDQFNTLCLAVTEVEVGITSGSVVAQIEALNGTMLSCDTTEIILDASMSSSFIVAAKSITNGFAILSQDDKGEWGADFTLLDFPESPNLFNDIKFTNGGTRVALIVPTDDSLGLSPHIVQVYDNIDGTWEQVGQNVLLTGTTEGRGYSLEIEGSNLFVGSPGDDDNTGYVEFFEFDGTNWRNDREFGFRRLGVLGSQFGYTIAMDYPIFVVGSPDSSRVASYIYEYSESFGAFRLRFLENYEAIEPLDETGKAIDLQNNTLIIGSPAYDGHRGQIRIYDLESGNTPFVLEGANPSDRFGEYLRLSENGNTLIVGLPSIGEVLIYENNNGSWERKGGKITSLESNDRTGMGIDISPTGDMIAVGSPEYRNQSGVIRVFRYLNGAWSLVGDQFPVEDPSEDAYVGHVVALGVPSIQNLTYQWSTGDTVSQVSVNQPGVYSLTVTDGITGCSATSEIEVSGSTEPSVFNTTVMPSIITCLDEEVDISALPQGDGPYQFVWSTGDTTSTIKVDQATDYTVTVTNLASGCENTQTISVPENTTPPMVAINSGGITDLDIVNTSITLDAGVSMGQGGLLYFWSTGDTSSTIVVTEADTYTVLVIDSLNGCSDRVSITITDSRCIAAIVGIDTLTCFEPTGLLMANELTGTPLADLSYTWSTGENTQTITVSDSGEYWVVIDVSTSQCSDTAFYRVVENKTAPSARIVADTTVFDCNTTAITLDGSSSTGQGPLGYLWSNDETTSSITANAAGTYSLEVTDSSNGCTATTEDIVLTDANIVVSITSNSPVCEGADLVLINGNQGAAGYLWTFPNGQTTTDQSPTIMGIDTTFEGTILNEVTLPNGCTYSGALELEVLDAPNVVIVGDEQVCEFNSLILSDEGGEAVNWSWSGPGIVGTLSGQILDLPNVPISSSGTYRLVATGSNGCTVTEEKNVIVNPPPMVGISVQGELCSDEGITLTESAGNAVSWSWSGPQGFTANSQSVTLDPNVVVPGDYAVNVTDINGCINATFTSVVPAAGQAVASAFLIANSACVGDSLRIIDHSALEGFEDVTFQWDFGDGTTSTERDPIKQYGLPGIYTINLIVRSEGCPSFVINKSVNITDCFITSDKLMESSISPNPSTGRFNTSVRLKYQDDVLVEVSNSRGQKVYEYTEKETLGFNHSFDLSIPGVYYVRFIHSFGAESHAVIVVN